MSDPFNLWAFGLQRGYSTIRDDGYAPDDYPRAGGYEYLEATQEQVAPFRTLFSSMKLITSGPTGDVRFAHDPVYSHEWISGSPAFPGSPGRPATPATPGYEKAEADIAQWRRMESDARTEVKNAGYSHRALLAYEKDLSDRMKAVDARMGHLLDRVPPALVVLLIEAFRTRGWEYPTSVEEVAEMSRPEPFAWDDIPLPHEAYPASTPTPYEEGTPRGLLEDAQQAYWELRRGNPDWDDQLEPFVVTYGLPLPLVCAQWSGLERFALAAGGLWDEVKMLEVLRRAVESILRPAPAPPAPTKAERRGNPNFKANAASEEMKAEIRARAKALLAEDPDQYVLTNKHKGATWSQNLVAQLNCEFPYSPTTIRKYLNE